eukprot:368069-Ditylum_brightwellii.AAC.2
MKHDISGIAGITLSWASVCSKEPFILCVSFDPPYIPSSENPCNAHRSFLLVRNFLNSIDVAHFASGVQSELQRKLNGGSP